MMLMCFTLVITMNQHKDDDLFNTKQYLLRRLTIEKQYRFFYLFI